MDGMRNRKCAVRKGFTLVELLVVIAIIALLMSILMPALAKVKKQAQAVLCQSRLKGWGIAFQMFTDDHDGYFMKNNGTWEEDFLTCMLPYIGARAGDSSEAGDIFFCPSATITKNVGFGSALIGTTFSAWGPFGPAGPWWDEGAMGSYGINDWCSNPPDDTFWGMLSKYAWRSPNVSGGNNVPVILDCLFCDGYPMNEDDPPRYPDVSDSWASHAMQFFCIDRHHGGIHGVFMDWSVRKIGLKELWRLKWHKKFETDFPTPVWPPWMRKYKDY